MNTAVSNAAKLAGTMTAGSTVADLKKVEVANDLYASRGGFVGFQGELAEMGTQRQTGEVAGMLHVPKEHRADFIKGMLKKAEQHPEHYEGFVKDMRDAKLIDANNNPLPENWVSGTSYLKANNLKSHNELVAGGISFSGALGENSTIQSNSLDSIVTGSKTENQKDTDEKVHAFNLRQDDKHKITKNSKTGKYEFPDIQTAHDFIDSVGETDEMEKTRKNSVNQTLATAAHYLGVSSEDVVLGVGGAVSVGAGVGLGTTLARRMPLFHKTKQPQDIHNDKRDYKGANTEADNIDTKHFETPQEKYQFAQEQVETARTNISDYNERKGQLEAENNTLEEKSKKWSKDIGNPHSQFKANQAEQQIKANNSEMADLDEKIAKENVRMEAGKKLGTTALVEEKMNKGAGFRKARGLAVESATELVKGFVVTAGTDELAQTALDEGHYQRANTYQALSNTIKGTGELAASGLSFLGGSIDAGINYLTGKKPLGSALAAMHITKSNDLLQTSAELVDDAGKIYWAMINKFQFAIFLSLTCRNSYYFTMKIHIDIDCFFASAARIAQPELEGKAIAIGGRSDTKIFDASASKQTVNFENSGNFVPTFYKAYEASDDDIDAFKDSDGRIRGILTTASYEAREYGIKTAMSIKEALTLCPHLIIKAPNMSLYQKLSHQLHEFLQTRIPLVEQASIDEFYGDLAGWVDDEEVPWFIDNLRHEIKKETKLPVSIGAAKTRYIAKLATTYAKPFGSKTIYPPMEAKFVDPIKVEDFAGIGRSMREKLHSVQIFTLGELRNRRGTIESWGPYAKDLYMRVCGLSDAPIKTNHQRKSIGISRTFDPIFDRTELKRRVHVLARHLSFAILKLGVVPTVYHLSISYEMRQKSHKNLSLCEIFTEKKFDTLCLNLFNEADIYKRLCVIRLSINCSSFTRDSKKELSLIGFADEQKMNRLTQETYELRKKYGLDTLKWGSEL